MLFIITITVIIVITFQILTNDEHLIMAQAAIGRQEIIPIDHENNNKSKTRVIPQRIKTCRYVQ
ncbi:MAG TPA: hypothetical protein VFV86_04375 [Nitrososphaeraceae archaeon]|nr:hypothetical protein [Nitrososphaeraceae archaeon]